MLAEVVSALRCPVCGAEFGQSGPALVCAQGHRFDVARQGYVNLLSGRASTGGDTAEMVAARAQFLRGGHFDFVAEALAGAAVAGAGDAGLVVDVGAGTGFYLAEVLRRLPGHTGLGLDVAKAAARAAGRAHPRAGAAVCDVWRALPLADQCADLVLDAFAPRNGQEFHRILRPDGRLLVVTPGRRHLAELVATLGLIEVDVEKETRLDRALSRFFRLETVRSYEREMLLSRTDAALLVAMGPSARHVEPAQVSARLAARPEPARVTASVELRVYRPVRSTDRPLPSHTAGPGTGPAAPPTTPGPTGAGRSRSSR
jgi:23S rRNA (guanine745-N1)-methyltransferase